MQFMRRALSVIALAGWAGFAAVPSLAGEELVVTARQKDGTTVPYILDVEGNNPNYVVILFPGGTGNLDPRMVNGKLLYNLSGNFLIRSRKHLVDHAFATVASNSSQSEERMQALLDDIKQRYPAAQIYLMGTSKGTYDTMRLSGYLSDKIAGVIHTASLNEIASFDARRYKNRHLLVHHRRDSCRVTGFYFAEQSHKKFGNELIVMDGGTSIGDDCLAAAYHGFNGIEAETVAKIKEWILRGAAPTKP